MAPDGLPEAATKLRLVLDYLPCEACLAQPTADQELLCTLCARLDRQVGVRQTTRTSVLVERPTPPPAPVVIAPAAPLPEPAAPAPTPMVVRFADEPAPEAPGTIDVVVEPLDPPAPVPVPLPLPVEEPPAAVESFETPPEPEEEPGFTAPVFEDVFEYIPGHEEFFDYTGEGEPARAPPRREPEPEPEPVVAAAPEPEPEPAPPEDDFVFRAPVEEAPEPAREERYEIEEVVPTEEVRVEPDEPVESPWAPPSDFLAEEEPAPEPVREPEPAPEPEYVAMEPVEDDVVEMEPVEDEVLETEIVAMEPVEDDVVEMEVIPDEPEPVAAPVDVPDTDLVRLRELGPDAVRAFWPIGIREIAHLSGHDAGELANRAGLPFSDVLRWTQAADLVNHVGVPVEAANALVAAGVAGPLGLRDADADDVAQRIRSQGGNVSAREIKRWKRRA